MTRARSLSQLANSNVFSVDANNSRVGIGSTIPDVKLDVGGDLYADNLTINNLIGVAATFSGVVSYEDVTNVDSVGIITARSYVSIADSIVHTGDINTAIRFPADNTFTVETAGAETLRIIGVGGSIGINETTPDSKVDIVHSTVSNSATENLIHLRTDPSGGYVTRGLFVKIGRDANYDNSAAHYDIVGSSGNSGVHVFEVQGDEKLRITKDGNVGIGTNNPASILHLLGTAPRITLTDTAGTDDVGKIFSTGGALFLQHRDGAGHGEIILRTENSSTAVERLRITSDGKVRVPDSGRFTCGTDDDLALRHSGTTGVLENNTGHFYIDQNTDDSDIYLRSDNGSGDVTNYVICDGGSGAVILNHYGSEKFTTTSSGVEVTGTVSDSIGPLRRLGANTQSGAYTLVAGDAGKYVAQATNSASVTVPNGVFSAGDMVTIVNLTATNINITQGAGLDLNFTADGTTGTRTLGAKGACTILFVSSGTSFISGSGLS
jgi:hypothetical protein